MRAWVFLALSLLFASGSHANDSCPGRIKPRNALIVTRVDKETEASGITSETKTSRLANTTGRCYEIEAQFIYLVDATHAVYRVPTDDYTNPLLLLDFGSGKVKHEVFRGVVKGIGKYTLKDKRGLSKTIPRMLVMTDSRSRVPSDLQ